MSRAVILVGTAIPIIFLTVACADEGAMPSGPWANVPEAPRHTDHSTFFREELPDGPSVTRACLRCHEDSAKEMMKTAHWRWEGEEVVVPGHDEPMRIGKKNVINNFCIGVQSNWPACTRCHTGYGWEDETFDFEEPSNVDCLVCHDQSGTYIKKGNGAGLPGDDVDLKVVAGSVGRPSRKNCGSCHFTGGGGNAVKHGDLDNTLLHPDERIDVHMGRHDLSCVDCHRTEQHDIPGRSISVSVDDTNRVSCTDCHDAKPHNDFRLDGHTDRLACQTCHIPAMAVGEATKMTWDWSEAGQDLDITDPHVYLKIKGRFTYQQGAAPEYAWYNGTSTRYILGDKMDPSKATKIAQPLGDIDDPKAKIWPFKIHRGKQPYDKKEMRFIVPHTAGEKGYWKTFDWETAAQIGGEATGLPYSGELGFAPTEMYWPLSHMVAPTEHALECADCHGVDGRMPWEALGYEADPLGAESIEHDTVELLDADETAVAESGQPLSMAGTCGSCHDLEDADFVDAHQYHRDIDVEALPTARRALLQYGPRVGVEGAGEPNCLACHVKSADHGARAKALAGDTPQWSMAATLGERFVDASGDGFAWKKDAVEGDEIDLGIERAAANNCGGCHGIGHTGRTPVAFDHGHPADWTTAMTGQVFSGQPILLSAVNLANKDALGQPWDTHAARLVTCTECHYNTERPARLPGEPESAHEAGTRRSCASCHDISSSHLWLPARDAHMAAVDCVACHVPHLAMGALEQVDRTVVRPDGAPSFTWRGVDDPNAAAPYVEGYRPLLALVASSDGGPAKVGPVNVVATWSWVDVNGTAVADDTLRAAWLDEDGYRAEVMWAFDADEDKAISDAELRLDTKAKVHVIAEGLARLGVVGAKIVSETHAFPIHHGITNGDRVNRDCMVCHAAGGAGSREMSLGDYLPGSVPVTLEGAAALGGEIVERDGGGAAFVRERSVHEMFLAGPAAPADTKTDTDNSEEE